MVERRNGQHPNDPNPDPIERSEDMQRVWELRRNRHTFAEIAKIMRMSPSTVHKLFKEGLKLQMPQAAEEDRLLAIQQIDEMLSQARDVFDAALDNTEKLKALMLQDRLLKSKRELMGLDAAVKFQGTVTHQTQLDQEVQELARQLQEEQRQEAGINGHDLHRRQRTPSPHRRSRNS